MEEGLRIIADKHPAHKTKEVQAYSESVSGRFAQHFISAPSSWLDMVERWFAGMTNKRIRRESPESSS
ncbi:MAG: transposase [Treponema sp.]|nr:transposase [Treponema sp.]